MNAHPSSLSDREAILTQQYVLEAFDYADGQLVWKKQRPRHHFAHEWSQKAFNTRQGGKPAGTLQQGYTQIRFYFGKVGAHRIVFLMHHGYMPEEVDHIDGDPNNNRIENLRAATHKQNLRNMKTPTRNTSGVKGVSLDKDTGKWVAGIRADGKWKHLGSFDSLDGAAMARKEAEHTYYGEFRNGR